MAAMTTRTRTRIHQAVPLLIAAAIAGGLGNILAQHHESVTTIVAVVASVLLNGSLAYGRRPPGIRVFACDHDDCPFQVTSTGHDQATEQALQTIVTEHLARHEQHGEATVR